MPAAAVLFELDAAALLGRSLPKFAPLPRQQSVWRDLAVIAGETVTHDMLVQTVAAAGAPLVRSTRLFDIYKPSSPGSEVAAGHRSLAFRLELRDDDVTLTDERVERVISDVLSALQRDHGARLRA